MTDISIESGEAADGLLGALGEQLATHGAPYTLAIVGGSALLALGLISRATRDVDVVALVDDGELLSAEPLPQPILDAAATVAADFAVPGDWLNPGPSSLVGLGLPEGFLERAERRSYGRALEVLFASRVDHIHLKLYATVDQEPGKHLRDLQALAPSEEELLAAARWSRTHDPSEGHLSVLREVLTHLGADHGTLDA